jgi:hypothetical protein
MAIDKIAQRVAVLMCVVGVSVAGVVAQTVIKMPKNRYTPEQDVELGRKAADEVRAPISSPIPNYASMARSRQY